MILGSGKKKLEEALLAIYENNRFTAYFFQNCEIAPVHASRKNFTAGICTKNHKVYLFYGEKFIESLTHNQILGLLVHEMSHIVRGHHKRTTKEYNKKLANGAQDMLINEDILVNAKRYLPELILSLPPRGTFLPQKYKNIWEDLKWEELYHLLKEDQLPQEKKKNEYLSTKDVYKLAVKVYKENTIPYFFSFRKEIWEVAYDGNLTKLTEKSSSPKIKKYTTLKSFKKDYPEKFWELIPLFSSEEVCDMTVLGLSPVNSFIYDDDNSKAFIFDFDSPTSPVGNKRDLFLTLSEYPTDNNQQKIKLGDIIDTYPKRAWEGIHENDGSGENDEDGGEKNKKRGFDDHEGFDNCDDAEIDRILDRAAGCAKGIGDGSANFLQILENVRKRDISWIKKIKSTVDYFSCQDLKPSWKKLNRNKLIYDIIERGYSFDHKKKLTVGVDTSGSMMGGVTLEACFGVVESLSVKYTLEVVLIDTEIKKVQKYEPGDWKKFEITGGGGTAFNAFFNDYLISHKEAVIMLTDGYVHTGKLKRYDNTIWVVTQENWEKPFGKYVYIDPERIK